MSCRRGSAPTPLLTEAYRRAIAGELERFEAEHPRMMRAIEWGLVATAVIRPAITHRHVRRGRPGGPHGCSTSGPIRSARSSSTWPRATAVTAGGEGALAGLAAPAQKLIADLFAEVLRGARRAAGPDDPRLRPGPAPRADRPPGRRSPRATISRRRSGWPATCPASSPPRTSRRRTSSRDRPATPVPAATRNP